MSTDAPRVLLRSEESGGEVSAIEIGSSPERKGPSLHHHDFDEAFYVLEGELTFRLRDELFTPEASKPIPEVITVGPAIGDE